jgi:RNA polymerase sigma-70 factor (ECF subfamily)
MTRDEIPAPLLLRVAQGDKAATQECVRRFGALVWSLALRSTHGDRAEAEDAVQEIFIEVWRSAGKYDSSKGSESLFVAMIARRRLIDRFRARVPESVALDDVSLVSEDDPAYSAELGADFRVVRAGLAQLKPEERQVLDLGFVRGLTQSEIVTKTGMPLGTVKSHMRRGLIRLREWMQASGSEGKEGMA